MQKLNLYEVRVGRELPRLAEDSKCFVISTFVYEPPTPDY